MTKIIKNNKFVLLFLVVFYLILVFCHFQTFVINDDLPYSLFYRADNRITNISGIISNQLFDYSHISPRVFIHFIVQFLLIFDKNMWSFINPLIIILIIISMSYLVKIITKTKVKNIYLVLLSIISFLLLYSFKDLIYWVAGSVNYVWVFLFLILFIIYYLKIGFTSRPILTFLICLCGSMLCETTGIFILIMIIADFIIKIFTEKEIKNYLLKYLFLLVGVIGGLLFILLSPSVIGRMAGDDTWSTLSLIDKVLMSIPTISDNLFNVFNIYNLYPSLLIISIIYVLFKISRKKVLAFSFIAFSLCVLGFLFDNGWFWFLLGVLLFVFECYILIHRNDQQLIPLLVAISIVAYSLMITPEYASGRVNFHVLLFLSIFIIYNFIYQSEINKGCRVFIWCLAFLLIVLEIIIYAYIGWLPVGCRPFAYAISDRCRQLLCPFIKDLR